MNIQPDSLMITLNNHPQILSLFNSILSLLKLNSLILNPQDKSIDSKMRFKREVNINTLKLIQTM